MRTQEQETKSKTSQTLATAPAPRPLSSVRPFASKLASGLAPRAPVPLYAHAPHSHVAEDEDEYKNDSKLFSASTAPDVHNVVVFSYTSSASSSEALLSFCGNVALMAFSFSAAASAVVIRVAAMLLVLLFLAAGHNTAQAQAQVLATFIPESYNNITKQFADSKLVLWRVLLYNSGNKRVLFPAQLAAVAMPQLKFQNNSRSLIIIQQAQKRKWYNVGLMVAQAGAAGITYAIASGVIKADAKSGAIASGVSAALVLLVPRLRQQQVALEFNPDWLLSGIISLHPGQIIEGALIGEQVEEALMKTWVSTITVAQLAM